jgi:hypothetical protein
MSVTHLLRHVTEPQHPALRGGSVAVADVLCPKGGLERGLERGFSGRVRGPALRWFIEVLPPTVCDLSLLERSASCEGPEGSSAPALTPPLRAHTL